MANKAVQLVQLLRSTKREKRLGTVILFVTSRCNSFCQTCFYHEELNRPGDMTFAQIEKVSRTMPSITDLWLSGGEPTLRHDASQIIDMFVRKNGVRRLIIPTNGLVKSRVYAIVDTALGQHPSLELYLNIALDGHGETHDRIRGVPGHWEKTLDCIEELYPLKEKHGARLRLNANTVVCAANYKEIQTLAEFMWNGFQLDGHYFNIVRGDTPVGDEIKQVPPEALPPMYAYVSRLTAWPFSCTAGETIAVIDYNGDVRACELREKFATLKDYDYDFGALWAAQTRQTELNAIDSGKACWCTHVCFIHDSMRHSRRSLLLRAPKNYLTRASW